MYITFLYSYDTFPSTNIEIFKNKFVMAFLKDLLLGDNGWITRRLNYVSRCQKSLEAKSGEKSAKNAATSEEKEDMEYLKHVKINEKDIEDLRLKLNSTRNLRKTMMKVPETDIREMFPFFFGLPSTC